MSICIHFYESIAIEHKDQVIISSQLRYGGFILMNITLELLMSIVIILCT